MRKGFRSSRGAMRGTRGGVPICLVGAVGFATVAIGVGPFVYSICLNKSVSLGPSSKTVLKKPALSVRRRLSDVDGVSVAAGRGAEVEKFAGIPEWNR